MVLPVRLRLFPAALVAALAALLAAAFAPEPAAAASKPPVVTSVRPLAVSAGQTLTLRGRHFRPGRNRNTVIFKRRGARALFVRADLATAKLLRVTVPKRLESALALRRGQPVATRFRLRVLAARASRAYTPTARSPRVLPPPPAPEGDCDGDGVVNRLEADDDGDLLADTVEAGLSLQACAPDSDGDGAQDGWEYRSAQDLNDDDHQSPNTFLPYPGKRPYPNPLFADAGVDYDGDGLALGEEHALWRYAVAQGAPRSLDALAYSEGEQYSVLERGPDGRRRPSLQADGYAKHAQFLAGAAATGHLVVLGTGAPWWPADRAVDIRNANLDAGVSTAERLYYDLDGDGRLSDDERDEDADGLTNYDETHGPLLAPRWWASCYAAEGAFPVEYAGTRVDDPDSDGDGVLDGADDADHDEVPNLMERSRFAAAFPLRAVQGGCGASDGLVQDPSPAQGRVNPFNPCLPWAGSRTCPRHPEIGSGWAPFGAEDAKFNYYVLN